MRRFLLLPLSMCLLIGAVQSASADIFVPAPITPPLLTLPNTIEKACASYYPADFDPEEAPGKTALQVYVLVTGAIGKIGVTNSSGSPTLDAAAIDCVRNLGTIFQPARVGDRVLAQWQELDIDWSAVLKGLPQKPKQKAFFGG